MEDKRRKELRRDSECVSSDWGLREGIVCRLMVVVVLLLLLLL